MKFKLRICLIIIIMLIAIVYLSNSTLSNSISNNSTSSGTIIDKADTDEISPDLYFEAKKDETIKEFIDRLGSSIKGEKEANVEYHVYECKGSTYKDLKEAMKKEELKETDKVKTNLVVEFKISYENGVNVGGDLFVATVVKGDITGTGEIDVTDISLMQEQLVETTELKCAYKEAADFNSDKSIDVVDLSKMQEYIVNN